MLCPVRLTFCSVYQPINVCLLSTTFSISNQCELWLQINSDKSQTVSESPSLAILCTSALLWKELFDKAAVRKDAGKQSKTLGLSVLFIMLTVLLSCHILFPPKIVPWVLKVIYSFVPLKLYTFSYLFIC